MINSIEMVTAHSSINRCLGIAAGIQNMTLFSYIFKTNILTKFVMLAVPF